MRQRRRPQRRRLGHLNRQLLEHGRPARARPADDFVARRFAADIVIGGNGSQHRNAARRGKGLRLAGAVILVHDQPGHADIAAQPFEILHRRANVVGHIKRLQIVGADHDHLLAHVARDRQAEPAAHHVAQEIQQHVIEIPLMEAQLLQQFEPVDNAAPAAAAPDLGAAQLHGEHAVALEAHIADRDLLAGRLFLR